ncbi:MAG: hypothetical protein JRI57_06870 [Deltaproteobacteria bacterium]|nr:hypothetical protein [Deltaproteobacteria bacterium]MBW1952513.1 hypothetical protein [Deltaproteobacteria bacterium]MBW1987274.1 hypothetical protein [Deltaproteobacteria bacterium]MBW2135132.1 hypothetical protein [Deltaproteobacteria bacterium]
MAGLFKKIRNRPTGQRYVISTIRKSADLFETAVFAANLLYIPRSLKHPELIIHSDNLKDACRTHEGLAQRLSVEIPARIFQNYT